MYTKLLSLVALVSCLAACGGGENDPQNGSTPVARATCSGGPAPSDLRGVYSATIQTGSSTGRHTLLMLVEDGETWLFYVNGAYSTFDNDYFWPTAFFQGNLCQGTGGSLVSAGLAHFFVDAEGDYITLPATASYGRADASTLTGSVSSAARTMDTTFRRTSRSDYAQPASLASLTGTWSLETSYVGETLMVKVRGDGNYEGLSNEGCGFSGRFAPHASGRNYFTVVIEFGARPCDIPGLRGTGIAVLVDGRLRIGLTDSARRYGELGYGSRMGL